MIWARVRHGGPWRRLLPGVIMLRNGTPTRTQAVDGALRYAGNGAVVTGLAAAELYGMRKIPESEQVHLLIPHHNKRVSAGYALIERTTRTPATVVKQGFPVADVTRAVLDAARRMTDRSAVEALIAEAVQRRWTTPRRLRKELEEGSDRGSALPRAVLPVIEAGAHSTAEARGAELADRSGLPRMRWNVRLRTVDGRILPRPDGWLDDVCLAWEIDSYEYHLSPADYARTLRRHATMTAHGIIVVHTLPSRLTSEPDAVIAELRAAYHHAARRPRPAIIAE
ncbi:hypothetical protein H0B56_11080 [Haloechinothrix sp. YIM 98757]|uniref:Transcriptional regulator, AbiEi antitoxin, Type IV TA system n=2 Tax=Haloechinothrix aidingensis TaxID=2752311 RepID=A0A838A439_9PSEU|nr:hypothetical protein [Haloechinothrix aidingensis]